MQFCNMRAQSQACLNFAEHAAKSTKSIMQYNPAFSDVLESLVWRTKKGKFGRDVISSLLRLRLVPHEITARFGKFIACLLSAKGYCKFQVRQCPT